MQHDTGTRPVRELEEFCVKESLCLRRRQLKRGKLSFGIQRTAWPMLEKEFAERRHMVRCRLQERRHLCTRPVLAVPFVIRIAHLTEYTVQCARVF